jgi:hypothetical protein
MMSVFRMARDIVRVIHPDGRREYRPAGGIASTLADYALMCALTYEPVIADGLRPDKWQQVGDPLPMPPPEWERAVSVDRVVAHQKRKLKLDDLVVQAWRKPMADGDVVVLIFRGTSVLTDWIANLNWFLARRLPFISDRYKQLDLLLGSVLEAIDENYPNATVIGTGHSLGGGLAQYSAYRSGRIDQVFAFNSSPVTGYFSVRRSERRLNKRRVKVFRIHERGEALAFIRGPIKALRTLVRKIVKPKPDSVPIVEYTFNFERRFNPIVQHGMARLAWQLYRLNQKSAG